MDLSTIEESVKETIQSLRVLKSYVEDVLVDI